MNNSLTIMLLSMLLGALVTFAVWRGGKSGKGKKTTDLDALNRACEKRQRRATRNKVTLNAQCARDDQKAIAEMWNRILSNKRAA